MVMLYHINGAVLQDQFSVLLVIQLVMMKCSKKISLRGKGFIPAPFKNIVYRGEIVKAQEL